MDLNNTEDKEMQKGRKLVRLGGILVIVALLGLIVLSFSSCNSKTEQMQAQIDSLKLVNDQLQLAGEYEQLSNEFKNYESQTQFLNNDSIILKYSEANDKVEKLLTELKTQKID